MTKQITDDTFTGEIKVASRIIDYLSSGLYKSPAACLKELINNSYDADAKVVEVFVKPHADLIIIEDDGIGISKEEFVRHFERVSESHKRDNSELTDSGRKKIGKIGIGFIAANELCEVMEIYSTKKGSKELLHVSINFSEMKKPIQVRRSKEGEIKKADYDGEILTESTNKHYTQIFLKSVKGDASDILASIESEVPGSNLSIYGLEAENVCELLKNKKNSIREWKEFDKYSETMLKVALNVPVRYHDEWVPKNLINSELKTLVGTVNDLDFKVYYDGSELRKPTVLGATDKKKFLDTVNYEGKNVSFKGYFYAQHTTIKPEDIQGLLIRIRNAAIGEYDSSFLEFPSSEYSIIQRWVSAEIWADDRLEDAMNIDRSTLRDTHPAYVEFRAAVHKELRKVLSKAQKIIYNAPERKRKRAIDSIEEINTIIKEREKTIPTKTQNFIKKKWNKSEVDKSGFNKSLLKKYTVPQLYNIVFEVANEVLNDDELDHFLRKLTERLSHD